MHTNFLHPVGAVALNRPFVHFVCFVVNKS